LDKPVVVGFMVVVAIFVVAAVTATDVTAAGTAASDDSPFDNIRHNDKT
jgi:hypothetical protein